MLWIFIRANENFGDRLTAMNDKWTRSIQFSKRNNNSRKFYLWEINWYNPILKIYSIDNSHSSV